MLRRLFGRMTMGKRPVAREPSAWRRVFGALTAFTLGVGLVLRALTTGRDRAPAHARPSEAAARQQPAEEPAQPARVTPGPLSTQRRKFLASAIAAGGGVGAAMVGVPVIGFLLSPVVRRADEEWRDVGALGDFPLGGTVEVNFIDPAPLSWAGFAATSAAWLRREQGEEFVAFSVYCTHTGCPVRWLPDARLFLCPCHGGAFHRDGRVAAGPPPEPLPQHAVRVRQGRVQIQTRPLPIPGVDRRSSEER